jgi:KaiC/GvpD/RAD55 family RecA-like ATPase
MTTHYFNSADARRLISVYGFSLFPVHGIVDGRCTCGAEDCGNAGKHPATRDGFKSATNDIEALKILWAERKHLNVGVATGAPSGIFVIDIDSADGEISLNALGHIPDTLTAVTGKGKHLYFKYPDKKVITKRGIIDGVDVRGDGGYVCGVGTNHVSGAVYEWVNPLSEISPAPQFILDLVTEHPRQEHTPTPLLNLSSSPLRLGGYSDGWTVEKTYDLLSHINPDCGYDEWVQVGMSLQSEGFGFDVWDAWSRGGTKYDAKTIGQHWKSFKTGGGVTFGTLVKMAQDGGWKPSGHTPQAASTVLYQAPQTVTTVDVETGEVTEKAKMVATGIESLDLDNIAPREFLYDTMIGRKYVTMLVAPPGAGKSIFTMQIALSAAAGIEWGRWKPNGDGGLNVWLYNNEEGEDELRRRIKAIMLHNEISKLDLQGKLYVDSGETNPISIAKVDGNNVIHTPQYDALLQEVIDRKIDVLIVDPFAETHGVSENSNEQIKDVVRLYRNIAFKANCAILLVHHTRKGASEGAGDADTARGGGAQIGVVRRMFTLSTMTPKEAEKMDVPPEKRKWFVRFDDAKTNITAPVDGTTWLKFRSVSLMNGSGLHPEGDRVGVLEHVDPEQIAAEFEGEMEEREHDIVREIINHMRSHYIETIPMKDAVVAIKVALNSKLSDRSLRDLVKKSINNLPQGGVIVLEGMEHNLAIYSQKGVARQAMEISLKSKNLGNDWRGN